MLLFIVTTTKRKLKLLRGGKFFFVINLWGGNFPKLQEWQMKSQGWQCHPVATALLFAYIDEVTEIVLREDWITPENHVTRSQDYLDFPSFWIFFKSSKIFSVYKVLEICSLRFKVSSTSVKQKCYVLATVDVNRCGNFQGPPSIYCEHFSSMLKHNKLLKESRSEWGAVL